jgi:hypothetical protein
MKKSIVIGLSVLVLGSAVTASADDRSYGRRGDRINQRLDARGARINQHLDARGDRINDRLDARAARARADGKYKLAERFDRQGDRIERHLDKKGDRIEAYWDRRGNRMDHRFDRRDQNHGRFGYNGYRREGRALATQARGIKRWPRAWVVRSPQSIAACLI